MAFTEGFEYDIFISYAHTDNFAPEGKKGWVDDFHEELEASLVRRFGYNKIAIWRDKNLGGNTRFDNRIQEVINHSALFLALVSPHYLQSDYCRKELDWFYNQANSGRFGLSVKDENRLFNILLRNIHHTSWPGELSGASGFFMHDAPVKSEEPGEPLYPEDKRFKGELRKIVDAIETTLKVFPSRSIQESTGEMEQESVRIFIADTADTLQATRDQLVADLEDKNVHILDLIPPPMNNKEHERSAAEAIQKANFTLHLLDELPGRKIIDLKTTTYPRQQLEIALHSETPQLIWIPKHLKYENVEDADYRTFLQSMENGPREEKKYEFIRSDQTNLADLILEKITQIQKENKEEADYPSILLDTHQKDQLFAFKLGQYLGSKGVKFEFNQESIDPLFSLQNFEKYLQQVRNLIIIFGQVTPAWVLGRLKKAINIIESQLKDVNKNVLENLWVYLLPSSQITGGISHLVKEHGIKLLDNRHSDEPDESVVERLFMSDRELKTCLSTHKNPFVGLRPFESTDSLYYFGRDEQTRALLQYLYRTRFLAVVGSSGSGKSSLVRAGLIPHLEAGFLVQDRDLWHIAKMKPGDQPLYNLAHTLVHAVEEEPSDEQIADFAKKISHKSIHALLERIAPILAEDDSNLFILVDQFEEVFRFGVKTSDSIKQEEAAAFVDLLLRLARQEDIPVYVCLTMRSDYIGDCDMFHGLPEAMNRSQYLVPRLTRRQRREAIEGPIRLSGAAIAPRLLDCLLNDSGEYRDDLPILQHALMRTWNEWTKQANGPMDTIHYEKIQTMEHALSQHADEAFNELSDLEKYLAKRLFQTLTETDTENRRIRRSVHLNEIAEVLDAPTETVMRVIKKFREDARCFLVLSSESAIDNPLVDICHESLMRQWGTLGNWMDEEAESAKIYKRLAETTELNKQDKAGLYTGLDLQIALDWERKEIPSEAWAKRYHKGFEEAVAFLDKSRTARDEKIQKEENKRIERERLLSEKADLKEKQAKQRQKSLRQIRILTIVISIFLVIAVGFAYLAKERSYEAKKQAQEAKRQTLSANYNLAKFFEEKAINALKIGYRQNSARYYKEAWLYMGAALKQEIDKDNLPLQPATAGGLLTPIVIKTAFAEKWFSPSVDSHTRYVTCVVFSPDGKTLASGSGDKTIRLWDVASGKKIRTITGHSDNVTSVAFSPNGNTLVSGSYDHTIRLWEVSSGEEIRILKGHSSFVNSVAISPDGKTLVSGSNDKTIRLWKVSSGKEIQTLRGHESLVNSVTFNPDGKFLVSGSSDQTIRLWEVATGKEIQILKGHSSLVNSVAISPDGKTLVSGSNDKTIRLWKVSSGKEIRTLRGHKSLVNSVTFNPDGKFLVSGSRDQTIRLWEVDSGKEIRTLTGHSHFVNSIAISPDGKTLVSGSLDKTIRLWDVIYGKEIRILNGYSSLVNSVAISPDGKTLASGSDDRTIRLWEMTSGKEINRLTGHSDEITSVTFNTDGNILASGSADKTIRLWEVTSGEEIKILNGHSNKVNGVAFSPGGKILVSGSDDKTIRLWKVSSGKEIQILTGHLDRVYSVTFSPDGKTLASGSGSPFFSDSSDNTIRLWEVSSGKEIRTLRGHSDSVNSVAFSPNGNTLASGSRDYTIRLWDVLSGKEIRRLTGHSNWVNSVVFSPEGKTLASVSYDKTILLWELASGKEIRRLTGHSYVVSSVAISPDGNTLALGSSDNTIRLWDMSIFNLFLKTGKPTPLFYTFSEGAEFFWGVQLEGLEYVPRPKDQEYDPKFRPLLDPPAPGQTKFEQILEWAKKHTPK